MKVSRGGVYILLSKNSALQKVKVELRLNSFQLFNQWNSATISIIPGRREEVESEIRDLIGFEISLTS